MMKLASLSGRRRRSRSSTPANNGESRLQGPDAVSCAAPSGADERHSSDGKVTHRNSEEARCTQCGQSVQRTAVNVQHSSQLRLPRQPSRCSRCASESGDDNDDSDNEDAAANGPAAAALPSGKSRRAGVHFAKLHFCHDHFGQIYVYVQRIKFLQKN
jgi:hypothetical protein